MVADVINGSLADMRRVLDEHTKRNSVAEVNSQQITLNQRDKDKQFCVNAFVNKAAQYHEGDLFDIQCK